ncbi:MAG TPA: FAD-dependent oxidoreductase [Vicinamibacterales bacterium]
MRLLANEPETPTTRRIRLALDGQSFSYHAGQAASLSVGGEPTPYSMASAPAETESLEWLEFLVKADGSTRFGAAVEELAPDTHVDVRGPVGSFTARGVAPEAPMLFIAGGTGIAPLRSMIHQAVHDRHAGPLWLVYSARTPNEFAYLADFQALARGGRLGLTLTLTGPADDWLHARGRTGTAHLSDHVRDGTVAFVCGPPAMVAEVPLALESLGVARDRIRTENW